MPFKIIRNDITLVEADAIVNTANPKPIYAAGTDSAIYEAAGADKLLAQRQKIGRIERGEAAVTDAFGLSAKYIIHTVGPIWIDGEHGELDTLRSCYENSLQKAKELKCESIAFPLISTGTYGFPKDKALEVAISAFSSFLSSNEMQITLVVYDKDSYQLSTKIMGEIDSYIDSNYVEMAEMAMACEAPIASSAATSAFSIMWGATKKSTPTLEEELANVGKPFQVKLFEYIDTMGISNRDVWKKANIDRKLFSKIQRDVDYHPSKKTAMSLCIALQLDLEQSTDLLARAGLAFNPSSKMDLIVQKSIKDKRYNIFEVNAILFKYLNETL